MNTKTFRIDARWLCPIIPRKTIYENYSVVVNNDKIIDILATSTAQNKYSNLAVIYCPDHILIPGLINMHTHAAMNILKGYADDIAFSDWLYKYMLPTEAKLLNDKFAYDGTILSIAEMLRGGTTFFNDMYFHISQVAQAAIDSKMRAGIGQTVINDDHLQQMKNFIQNYDHKLITSIISPHSPYAVNNEIFQKINRLAAEYDLNIGIHLHESVDEINDSAKQYQQRPIQRLAELDFLNSKVHAVHMVQLNDDDIATIQQYDMNIVHCPESNLKLSNGVSPVTTLLSKNINVALGTDSAASNNDIDMFGEMRTAALLAKGITKNPKAIPAWQILEMATINGAKSLGLQDKIGSIEINKQADIVAVAMNDISCQPLLNPISQLIYCATRNQVTDSWIAGDRVLAQGKLLTINDDKINNIINYWQQRVESCKKELNQS